MRSFEMSRRVAHSAQHMFALVADVERYPEFVPLCGALKVTSRQGAPEREVVLADMTAAYKTFRETFTSRVTLEPGEGRILVEYIDGPFRHLENRWSFTPEGSNASIVNFFIAYEFRSFALQLVAGAVFDKAFHRFMEAFEARADSLHPATNHPGISQ